MVKKTIKNTILKNDLLSKGDHVIVGLSGGPDSVCLFFSLLELKSEFELSIISVHVNHMLRPGDAEKDQAYAETLCKDAGITCKVSVLDCVKIAGERGITTEEAGRDIRYEAFYQAAKELIDAGVKPEQIKIAVAQNKNDLAETMLMRIIRGTGVNGLSGIEYKRGGAFGTTVIRPLLDLAREDIENYCKQKGITPRIDLSNKQPIYTRNKVRLTLIPYIEEHFNENIVDALARLSQSAKEDNGYLWKQAQFAYNSLIKVVPESIRIVLDRNGLKKMDPAIRRRVVLLAFRDIGLVRDIQSPHLMMIDDVLFGGSASGKVNLPGNYMFSVSYDEAAVYLENIENEDLAENRNLKTRILTIEEYKAVQQSEGGGLSAAFDYRELSETYSDVIKRLALRTRRQGDYFTPKGMKTGRKKVQDYFVDRKIPKGKREYYLLVVLGNEVLWIFDPLSGRYNESSEKYGVTDKTKEVLMLEIDIRP